MLLIIITTCKWNIKLFCLIHKRYEEYLEVNRSLENLMLCKAIMPPITYKIIYSEGLCYIWRSQRKIDHFGKKQMYLRRLIKVDLAEKLAWFSVCRVIDLFDPNPAWSTQKLGQYILDFYAIERERYIFVLFIFPFRKTHYYWKTVRIQTKSAD